jgi:hypothetical protein
MNGVSVVIYFNVAAKFVDRPIFFLLQRAYGDRWARRFRRSFREGLLRRVIRQQLAGN